MARKKQRKRTAPGRAGAASGTATTGRRAGTAKAPAAPAAVKPAPATPGGPNRPERKEAARLARERMRRKAVRGRLYRRAGVAFIVLAVIAGIVLLATRPKGSPLNAEETSLLKQAPRAVVSAGCGPVVTTKDYPNGKDRTHIGGADFPTGPPLSTYPTIPPASGPHNQNPLASGVYSDPPDIYQTIHSMEHAGVIIWYSPTATSDPKQQDELVKLQNFFQKPRETDNNNAKVIVAPYNYPDQAEAGQLPKGKNMVMVAWHRIRSCNQISLAAAFDFAAHYRFPPPKGEKYLGASPPEERTLPI